MAFWTSESFLIGISTFQSHSRRTTFMVFQAQLCTTLPSVECGKKITTWNRRNMGTSAVKDFCSSVPVWHRFVLLKPLLINMMPWINESLDNPPAQKFPIFSKVLLKPSMLCCSDFTICEKSKHLPFFFMFVFFLTCVHENRRVKGGLGNWLILEAVLWSTTEYSELLLVVWLQWNLKATDCKKNSLSFVSQL